MIFFFTFFSAWTRTNDSFFGRLDFLIWMIAECSFAANVQLTLQEEENGQALGLYMSSVLVEGKGIVSHKS
jgi:hypothetical protein